MTLRVTKLHKNFKGIRAVSGLDFELYEGEILGLMGPNGAGKTTLINLITGFYKPDLGNIQWENRSINGLKPFQIVRIGIARTFQQARVFQNMSVEDNLFVSVTQESESNLFSAMSREERIDRILDFVEMKTSKATFARDLTQDDLRRLEIARALCSDPKLLILDEPVSGLTPEECDSIMKIITKLNEMGLSLLIVEHVMRMLMRVSHRLLVISSGVKLCEGTPEEICRNPAVIEAYLGDGSYDFA